ncbi:MAG: zinc metalloprotease HtpX [Planctomycetes bacterium]|nr:zinc metalloprotease HtpX [Planctomycetota bacterium]
MALCMLIGYFSMGAGGLLLGFMFGGVANVLAYFYSDKIAIAAHGGQPISRADAPELYDTVERLAERAGLPMPRLYVCPQAAPNAFATGRNPRNAAVAVSAGMLRSFPMREVAGVVAHELAHIKHRDVLISTIAAVMAGVISYAAHMFWWFGAGSRGSRDGGNPLGAIGAILMIVLAPLAALLIQTAISRQREYAADSYGAELVGNPDNLADALERLSYAHENIRTDTPPAFHSLYIAQPLSGQGFASLFSTHPPIEKRIAALRRMAGRG